MDDYIETTARWGKSFVEIIDPTQENQIFRAYFEQPKREWVGLTDEEKAQFVVAYYPSNWDRKTAVSLMNEYEKYLKEKNT
jgi:hypothetical protein